MVSRLRSWWQNRSKLLLVVGAMASRLRSWRQNRSRLLLVVGAMVLLVGVVVLIIAGYTFKWDWTGFNEQRGPNILQYQPAKTLWDWLQLLGVLAIPVAVVLGVAWVTTKQGQVSDAENKDNQREAALQAYIDNMLELLLAKNLRSSTEDEEVQKIARVRTLTVLRRLDAERKGSVLQFLQESGLIGKDKRVINLTGANLNGANLNGANLSGADLSGANLRGALVTAEQLTATKLLQGATMPDGSKHS